MVSSSTIRILYIGLNDISGYLHLQRLVSSSETIVGVITPPSDIRFKLLKIIALFARIFRLRSYSFQTIIQRMQHDLCKISREHKLSLFLIRDINSDTFLALCKALNPDIILVGSWNQRISDHILKIPKLGCVNSHPAYLPKHRGASPHISVIMNDEKEAGVTIHYMDKNFDTGKIILQRKTDVLDNDTGYTLYCKLAELGSVTLLEAVQLIKQGKVAAKAQDDRMSTYNGAWRWRRDGRIDWAKTPREIYNLIRAASRPDFLGYMGGAYTYRRRNILKIWEAEELKRNDITNNNFPPGTILQITEEGLIIRCGQEGAILVKTVQQDGILRKRMSAACYARKAKVRMGDLLGA